MFDFIAPDGSFSLNRFVLLLVLVVVSYPFLRTLYNISPLHPLYSYPGPLLWRASRLPWILALRSGYLHLRIKSFHEVYGPEVRIAPNEISYTNPQAWKDIYASKPRYDSPDALYAGVIERNPTWFQRVTPQQPWSILGPNEAAHARYRRAFMGAFSDKALHDYSSIIESHVDLFVRKLRETSSPVDLASWFTFLTFDISGALSFGQSFGSTEAGRAHPWVAICYGFGKGVGMVASMNFLGLTSRFNPLASLLKFAIPRAARDRMVYHKQLTAEKVGQYLASAKSEEEKESSTAKAPFLDTVLRFNQTKDKEDKVTKPELDINMSILVFAGSETTSSALSATFRYLLLNKPYRTALTHEIRTSFAHQHEIRVSTVSKLEYLTAIISESMRMGPPNVIGVPRIVPKGGAIICDKLVPAGTFVVVNQYPTYRSPLNFAEPDAFKPERFLKANDAEPHESGDQNERGHDNLDAFQPFAVGRHQCIGHRLAWAEMRLVVARLLYAFDIEQADEKAELKDFVEQKMFIFWEKEPLMVRLRARTDSERKLEGK